MNVPQQSAQRPPRPSTSRRIVLVTVSLLLLAAPAVAGFFTFLEVFFDGEHGVDGLDGAAAVALSGDGRHVFTAGRDDDAVVMWRRDLATGRLELLGVYRDGEQGLFGLDGVAALATSPDGRHVYATAKLDDTLVVFRRDATNEALFLTGVYQNAVGGVFGLDGASAVTVSPDGNHVYVTGQDDDALAVFRRWATNDDLVFADLQQNGSGGVVGLGGASAVAVSPDGRQVYATGRVDDSLVVFTRDATRDALAFFQVQSDGQAGIDGLARPTAVATSPDGRHVYVASAGAGAVVVFARERSGGLLSFVEVEREGAAGVEGIAGASAVVANAAGNLVFVAGEGSDSVAVFDRDSRSGTLRWRTAFYGRVGHLDVLAGASDVALTPDSRQLLVTGLRGDTLALFDVATIFSDGFEDGSADRWSVVGGSTVDDDEASHP